MNIKQNEKPTPTLEYLAILTAKKKRPLQKAFGAMEYNVNLARNNFLFKKFSNFVAIYMTETVEKIVNTVQKMHNKTAQNKKLFQLAVGYN